MSSLWLGNVGDVRDLRRVLSAGITALVDLAVNEAPLTTTRDLVYCRFPLIDGAGNDPWLLRMALETTANLIRSRVPTLVFCGAGMSRSPAIAAGAMALAGHMSLEESLALITRGGPCDLSPALWDEVDQVLLEWRSSVSQ
jgi:hypothetical protein